MRSSTPNGNNRLLRWLRVREFAVPPLMITTATGRRRAGDWAGACAAARVDVDLDLRGVVRAHGFEIASRVRADLRHLAPDLLRWHLPRIAPDGLLRPGVTMSLAVYDPPGAAPLHLVARTPPAWADAGQRISLALWDRSVSGVGGHPHPRPDRRFRLDLHRHLWDAREAHALRSRTAHPGDVAGRERPAGSHGCLDGLETPPRPSRADGYAVHRWADEARLLIEADGLGGGPVLIRLGAGRRLRFDPDDPAPADPASFGSAIAGATPAGLASRGDAGLPVLPDAAVRVPPDLELLEAGLIDADRLHPLVAAALVPGCEPREGTGRARPPARRTVECGGAQHRIGLVDGALAPLDHDPAELRRERMVAALGGPPMPCLRAIDQVVRHPESLDDVRARLDHGDYDGALTAVERLLGPTAVLRDGALRDELEAAAARRLTHSLYRAGLTGHAPPHPDRAQHRPTRRRTKPAW